MNTFLTHDQLQITEAERHWLIEALKHPQQMTPGQLHDIPGDGRFLFDMNHLTRRLHATDQVVPNFSEVDAHRAGSIPNTYSCGTAGCIAGLMHVLSWTGGAPLWQDVCDADTQYADDDEATSPALLPLFWPPGLHDYSPITPAIAADTIERFLSTGILRYDLPSPK